MLEDEDFSDGDSDFESGDEVCAALLCSTTSIPSAAKPASGHLCALRRAPKTSPPPTESFASANPFQAIAEDNVNDLDEDTMDAMNGWAHKVKRQSSRKAKAVLVPKPVDVFDTFTVRSEKDLDALLVKNPGLAVAPLDKKHIKKVIKTMPAELICGPDETLCLMDSGSTVNAAWIEKHFPGYLSRVTETPASRRGDSATTACGKKLINKGRCIIHATAQGESFAIAFKDMETELPILSVRKIVKKGCNDVRFKQGGGSIRNRQSGKVVKFFEHEGVYFIKLKIKDPNDLGPVNEPRETPVFHRLG
jgi:hypothetical protein